MVGWGLEEDRRGEGVQEQWGRRVREDVVMREGWVEVEGGVSYPDPMAAPLWRWMKAPRPAVVAVTNLLRFSARLEARGRGHPPPQSDHDHQLPLISPSTLLLICDYV